MTDDKRDPQDPPDDPQDQRKRSEASAEEVITPRILQKDELDRKPFDAKESGAGMAKQVIRFIFVLALVLIAAISYGEFASPPAEVKHAHALLQAKLAQLGAIDCVSHSEQCIEAIKQATELVNAAKDARRLAREFWVGLCQLLLINLLLPVLTALLGYVFGTQLAGQK